jgi:Na+/melibiose symporter-like transporter
MEYGFESNIIERKAFLLMLAFGFASTGILVFQVGFQFYYFRSIASSAEFFVAFGVLINAYSFLVNPVLLFVAFYKVCGRNFSGKTASTLTYLGSSVGGIVGMGCRGRSFCLDYC